MKICTFYTIYCTPRHLKENYLVLKSREVNAQLLRRVVVPSYRVQCLDLFLIHRTSFVSMVLVRLERRRLLRPSACPFCDQVQESIIHFLLGCVLARTVWAVCLRWWDREDRLGDLSRRLVAIMA
jgi:hypothetical protein